MKRDIPLIVATLLAGVCAHAEEVRLEWQPDQIAARVGYYNPIRLELSPAKPEGVTKLPDGLKAPLYGTLKLGPQENPTRATVLLDEPEGGAPRLWVDRNANGDLTDDPVIPWDGKPAGGTFTTFSGSAGVEAAYGAEKRTLGLKMYRFDKSDPKRAALRNILLYYRSYGFAGQVSLGGKEYPSVLVDDGSTGDFRGSEGEGPAVSLLLDLNGDGKFDSKAERFNVRQPFNVSGTTYEITGLTASGGAFTIAKSDKTVAELPKAPAVGGRPAAFEQKNIQGEPVRFPEDYKGKLVLLDFWATWCGPCIKELPNVTKVYEEFHPKGFEILGVSLDSASGLEKLAQFTKDKAMPWPQVCDTKGWMSPIAALYSVQSIPAAFLIDGKSGAIVAMGNELRGEGLRTLVERSLAKLDEAPPAKIATTLPAAAPPSKPAPAPAPSPLDPIIAKATAMLDSGKFLTADLFAAQKHNPQAGPVVLAQASTAPLPGREIARRAAAGYVRAGWFFQCTKCGRWHVNLAGGYAVAGDTVVTAHHVMEPPENMKPGVGHPILVRGENEVLPVTAVVADDSAMDAIVMRAAVTDLSPLPLGGDLQIGDNVWCLSDPRGERGYFSAGIVNRFVERTVGDARGRRINVSTDWAPGSSGAAVLDGAGNVIGHVATIRALFGKAPAHPPEAKPGEAAGAPAQAMNLHEAIPAKSVLTLIPK